jgi:hypothetical protein
VDTKDSRMCQETEINALCPFSFSGKMLSDPIISTRIAEGIIVQFQIILRHCRSQSVNLTAMQAIKADDSMINKISSSCPSDQKLYSSSTLGLNISKAFLFLSSLYFFSAR